MISVGIAAQHTGLVTGELVGGYTPPAGDAVDFNLNRNTNGAAGGYVPKVGVVDVNTDSGRQYPIGTGIEFSWTSVEA